MTKRLNVRSPLDSLELSKIPKKLPPKKYIKPVVKFSTEGIQITGEYKKAKDYIESGCPVIFVSGNAGTGKSTLIKYLRSTIDKKIVVLAPTGVAALNIEGSTIHSFFRLPPKIHNDEDIKVVSDKKIYQKLELLIVDEVSMVRCDILDSIDKFLRKNRPVDAPFGGVQVLLVGDLFQLPPVIPRKERDVLLSKGYAGHHFFNSFVIQDSPIVHVELTTIFRQKESSFISLLNNIRFAENVESTLAEINKQCYNTGRQKADITLTCTNNSADQININELHKLQSKEYTFTGEIAGKFNLDEDKLPSPMNLKLKVGAHVMFTRNDDSKRWVNGSLGIIRGIDDGNIRVEIIDNDRQSIHLVERVTWETYRYTYDHDKNKILSEVIGEYTQFPLTLAWAVTIHKSQGKTLQNVLIDLGSGAFDSGQVYVALSRCRSIDGIQLARPIRQSEIKCDPMIKQFLEMVKDSNRFTQTFLY
ncbi:MAG: AAA family ATPase [bacterium]